MAACGLLINWKSLEMEIEISGVSRKSSLILNFTGIGNFTAPNTLGAEIVTLPSP